MKDRVVKFSEHGFGIVRGTKKVDAIPENNNAVILSKTQARRLRRKDRYNKRVDVPHEADWTIIGESIRIHILEANAMPDYRTDLIGSEKYYSSVCIGQLFDGRFEVVLQYLLPGTRQIEYTSNPELIFKSQLWVLYQTNRTGNVYYYMNDLIRHIKIASCPENASSSGVCGALLFPVGLVQLPRGIRMLTEVNGAQSPYVYDEDKWMVKIPYCGDILARLQLILLLNAYSIASSEMIE